MGRQPCCDKVGLKKGPWTAEEDRKLISFILTNGQCCWRAVPKLAGLLRCGKSCRLRWTNYLRPDLKRGLLTESEEKLVIDLHEQLGNRNFDIRRDSCRDTHCNSGTHVQWSKIASHLPGRTDNEIKNHWNTHIKKKLKKMGIDPLTHKPLLPTLRTKNNEIQERPQEHAQHGISQMDQSLEIVTPITQAQDPSSQAPPVFTESDGFCIDEVPLVEPHEINLPNCHPSSSSSSSSYSSSSLISHNNGYSSNILEDFEHAISSDWDYDFSNMSFWDDYNNMTNSLELLISGDSGVAVNCENTHQDPWNIELF